MPMHDWTRAGTNAYYNFRFLWTAALLDRLNATALPRGFFAVVEPKVERAMVRGVRYARKTNRIAIHAHDPSDLGCTAEGIAGAGRTGRLMEADTLRRGASSDCWPRGKGGERPTPE